MLAELEVFHSDGVMYSRAGHPNNYPLDRQVDWAKPLDHLVVAFADVVDPVAWTAELRSYYARTLSRGRSD